MNQKDQLRIAKLATTLIVEHPKATNDINRLKWMKSAIELLNLKQSIPAVATPEPEPVPEPPAPGTDKEEIIYLKQVIAKTIPDMADIAVSGRISTILKDRASDDSEIIKLGYEAVNAYREEFLKQAKRYQWGKI